MRTLTTEEQSQGTGLCQGALLRDENQPTGSQPLSTGGTPVIGSVVNIPSPMLRINPFKGKVHDQRQSRLSTCDTATGMYFSRTTSWRLLTEWRGEPFDFLSQGIFQLSWSTSHLYWCLHHQNKKGVGGPSTDICEATSQTVYIFNTDRADWECPTVMATEWILWARDITHFTYSDSSIPTFPVVLWNKMVWKIATLSNTDTM